MLEEERPHGKVNPHWQGKMLVINIDQSFNLAGIRRASRDIKQLVDNKPVAYWARCYVYDNDEGLGPISAKDDIINSVRYGIEHGGKLLCIVRGNVLIRETFSIVAKECAVPVHFFDSLEQAEDFVNASSLLM